MPNKCYSLEEVIECSTEYFNGDKLSAEVFANKYALKNKENKFLEKSPDDMHKRIAKEFARVESKYPNSLSEDTIYNLLKDFKYVIPQGSPMFGIGNKDQTISLGNCFVIDCVDSYGGICRADERLAQISKRRGGVGIDISPIRPAGLRTNNSSLTTDGISNFMERFSNTIREVGQCVCKGEQVITQDGIVNIEDVKSNDLVWTKNGWIRNIKTFSNGIKPIFEITTKAGYKLKTSEDHIYQTVNEFGELQETRLKDICTNDRIVLCLGPDDIDIEYIELQDPKHYNVNNKPSNCKLPKVLDEKLAYVLGYSYGDGYVGHNSHGNVSLQLACSNDHPEIKNILENNVSELFDYTIKYSNGDGNLENLSVHNKTIVEFLEHNKLLKQKCGKMVFPELILRSNNNVKSAFIAGYFDADGYASGAKKGYSIASVDIDFIQKTQLTLSSIGITSKLHKEIRESNWKDLYTLCVVGKTSQERFIECISKFSVKTKNSMFVSKRDCWLTPFTSKTSNVKSGKYGYCPSDNFMSMYVVKRLLNESNYDINNKLIQDFVVDIKQTGVQETYDLSLESHNLFWCNGFYVHNSGRRGALMQSISVHHPEVETFIDIKKNKTKVTGANISVRISNEFMEAVLNDSEYEQRWPVDSKTPKLSRKVNAKEIWDKLVQANYDSAEPGILFWDTIIENSPADCYEDNGFKTLSTNPCGELPLPNADSCRLLLQNLKHFIINPFKDDAYFDFELFKQTTRQSQRLMDDLIDLELECLDEIIKKIESDPEDDNIKENELSLWKEIKEKCKLGRRTGLGITALGDAIARMGYTYGDKNSLKLTEEIYKTLRDEAYRTSVELAKERGAFPIFDANKEKNNKYLKKLPKDIISEMKIHGRRNISILTTAPAGSVSVLARTTSGFEPVFKAKYVRKRKLMSGEDDIPDFIDAVGDKWKEYEVYHVGVNDFVEITGKPAEESPYFKSEAGIIEYNKRVDMQSIATNYVDHSISSTVNLPKNVDINVINDLYIQAYKGGCKGLTIYRDGCRDGILTDSKSSDINKRPDSIIISESPSRPEIVPCEIHRSTVGGGAWLFFVGIMNGRPYEVFGGDSSEFVIPKKYKSGWIKKNGKVDGVTQYHLILGSLDDEHEQLVFKGITKHFNNYEYGAFTRLNSLSIRHGVPIKYICEQITKKGVEGDLFSFQRALSRVLKKYIVEGESAGVECPDCGSSDVIYKGGCPTCTVCGHSKCS
jgi:ribonucleoside-diphosphate reductase alpha chain